MWELYRGHEHDREIESYTTLEDLWQALHAHIQNQYMHFWAIHMEKALSVLHAYSGVDWKAYISFDAQHYTRYRVPMPPEVVDFDMYLIWWEFGQMSAIHDHADNGCIFKVLDGDLTEKRYTRDQTGSFVLQHDRTFGKGNTLYIADDIGYHALGNMHTEKRWVSLHVYSPAKYVTTYFE